MSYEMSDAERDSTFPPTRLRRRGTFEIAFALAGTVSAGAYTAGVLDYLLEALDAWEAAKERGDPDAPRHSVTISTLAGASGGALNGAIFLRAAGRRFPHGAKEENPFYASWCGEDCVTISRLLAPGGSVSSHPFSLLNTRVIEDTIGRLIHFADVPGASGQGPTDRRFLSDPLRLSITLSNVTGTPYLVDLRSTGTTSFEIWRHDDIARFALSVPGGNVAQGETERLGETRLDSASTTSWDLLKEAALATCAFPLAFNARFVSRTAEQIAARVAVVQRTAKNAPEIVPMVPNWAKLGPGLAANAHATMVDGGATNNEPIGIAHAEITGLTDSNPRSAKEADRAVVLIDPFATPEKMPEPPDKPLDLAGGIARLLLNQARYRAGDIALAADKNVYSRFLIGADVDGGGVKTTLASGGLNAFGGFIDRELLKHDFALGRSDAFLFLTRSFRFDPANPTFLDPDTGKSRWTDEQIETYTGGVYAEGQQDPAEAGFLPMIPLMAALRAKRPERMTAVPTAKPPPGLRSLVSAKLDELFARALPAIGANMSIRLLLQAAWKVWGHGAVRDRILDALDPSRREKPAPGWFFTVRRKDPA